MATTSSSPVLTDQPLHAIAPEVVVEQLGSHAANGLSQAEAQQRQEKYGLNKLASKAGTPPWLRFLHQFNEPLILILLVAGAIKAFLASWVNAGVIWGVTLINAIIGYVQEAKAESAIAALASAVETEATVIRDGQTLRLPSQELVPGDIVLLKTGDKVPADLRLLHANNLQVNESALTGESVAVEKHITPLEPETPLAERVNMAYAGSFVTAGKGRGVVVAIANQTETGKISQLIDQQTNLSTPLTRKFNQFSRTLLYIILGIAACTFAIGLGYGNSWVAMFEAAVALAVSAIPEGLPAVVTVTLAIGVARMARRHAIIRKLPAVEALGGATVICSDKTGTLTENQMTVQAIYAGDRAYTVTGEGYDPRGEIQASGQTVQPSHHPLLQQCLLVGLLCNDSYLECKDRFWSVVGAPTEGALLAAAQKAGLVRQEWEQRLPRLDSIPFDSEFKYMATLHRVEASAEEVAALPLPVGAHVIFVKGSVEAIVQRAETSLDVNGQPQPIHPEEIHQQVEAMASQGLRVLAMAQKPVGVEQVQVSHRDLETGLVFVGLQGMIDPPRPEAIRAVAACKTAGIQVKMITGDHVTTAAAIAERMGITKNNQVRAFTGRQLAEMDAATLSQAAEEAVVFARVTPEQKLRLVEALQARGESVAMTGDGVNDAPALRQADIGIAMGQAGTEVAKEAADMILTDDNFASIEAAVEEGRTVYRNLLKAIAFILPVNGGESMTILLSTLLNRELPILSLQVLWLNMVNSISMTVPLAFEPKSEGVMQQPPRNPQSSFLSGQLLKRIILISVFNWIVIFGMFEWVRQSQDGSLPLARTMAIQALVAGRIIYLLSISQLGVGLWKRLRGQTASLNDAAAVGIGIVGAMMLQVVFSQWGLMNQLFGTAPLNWPQWGICLLVGLPMAAVAWLANRIDPLQ